MNIANPINNFQDWFTQQWVILWGKRIEPETLPWLMGPFGNQGSISDDFIIQLATKEGLLINRNKKSQGIISSIRELKLSDRDVALLSKNVIEFYENTSDYNLKLMVKWNPIFKIFGRIVSALFSKRIDQLNIPTNSIIDSNLICSEIITLTDSKTDEVKYTIWYRTIKATDQVLYSGVYSTCTLPSGKVCVKAVFPLPEGNATVIMSPEVGSHGELHLNSSGKTFGDPGFYFLVKDSRGDFWSQYISSFQDHLMVYNKQGHLYAEQTLTLWHQHVLSFKYDISVKQ